MTERAGEPAANEPATEPVVSGSVVGESVVSEPVVSKPGVSESVVTEPVVSEPVVDDPADPPAPTDPAVLIVTARPLRTARAAKVSSAVILLVFIFIAIVMRHDNAGVTFVPTDQLGTLVIGLVLAGAALLPTRPRLWADAQGVRIKAFLGSERVIGWELIVRVEFPKKLRFARIVLPGEEALALWAVQRWDHQESVQVMRQLRELHAASRAKPNRPVSPGSPAPLDSTAR